MDIEKQPDGYWITNIPDTPNCGPYKAKSDASKARTGLTRFFKHEDEKDFFTVERLPDGQVMMLKTED